MKGFIGLILVVLAHTSDVQAAPACVPSTAQFVESTFIAPHCPAVRLHELETSVAFEVHTSGISSWTRNTLLIGAIQASLGERGSNKGAVVGELTEKLLKTLDATPLQSESHRYARKETPTVSQDGIRMKAIGEVDKGIATVTVYLYREHGAQ